MALYWIGGQIEVVQLAQPGAFVRREHVIGRAGSGEDFIQLEHHLVLDQIQAAPGGAQGLRDGGIARSGERLVVAAGVNRFGVESVRQRRYQAAGAAVQHMQAAADSLQFGF
jgi:hypothetical protein